MELKVQLIDEASAPSAKIQKALEALDNTVQKLTQDFRVLDAVLAGVTPRLQAIGAAVADQSKEVKSYAQAVASLTKEFQKVGTEGQKAIKKINEQKAAFGFKANDKFSFGGFGGQFFATGPLGFALGAAVTLGKAFEDLTDKVMAASFARDRETTALAGQGVRDPDAYRAAVIANANKAGVSQQTALAIADIITPRLFNGTQVANEATARRYVDAIARMSQGDKGRATEIAGFLKSLPLYPSQESILRTFGKDYRGSFTRKGVEDYILGHGNTPVRRTAASEADRVSEGIQNLLTIPSSPELIEALKKLNEALRDPKVIQSMAGAMTHLTEAAVKLLGVMVKMVDVVQTSYDWWSKLFGVIEKSEVYKRIKTDQEQKAADAEGTSFRSIARGLGDTYFNRVYRLSQTGADKKPLPGEPGFVPHAEGGVTLTDHPAQVHRDEVILPLSKAADVLSDTMAKSGRGGHGGSVVVHPGAVSINVTQQPGESTEELSRRLADLVPVVLNSAFEQMSIQATGGIS